MFHQLIRCLKRRISSKRVKQGSKPKPETDPELDEPEPEHEHELELEHVQLTRLSSLPDEVLCSILELLPVDEAVRTCILSRRWQHLWMSTRLCLNFVLHDEHWRDRRPEFINFVDRVIALHVPHLIKRFVLVCSVLHDGPLINSWIISTITKSPIQALSLSFWDFINNNDEKPYLLPHSIFNSQTLVELDLTMGLQLTLQLPLSISLPRLKVLSIAWVLFMDDTPIQKLTSASPSLETLSIINCVWKNVAPETITAPRLRMLEITMDEILSISKLPPLWIQCAALEELHCGGKLRNAVRICGPTPKIQSI